MQMTRSRLQLPRAALPPAGKVPAGGRLILCAPNGGDQYTRVQTLRCSCTGGAQRGQDDEEMLQSGR